ncbi:hypothetical protein [Chryseobacterium salviniae]|uniref:Cathepsin propeptide inhibitor domain-containing protein n=1 Tax=Chryseobacterium salviniae TaxID=3101750 RepID=A0ABU6HW01_9FLAO|nr:hypothetical protein [Chryseobacterium sp. T9W2-O]MEC3877018.1 hypothetical protein [Chryseobacterium sp. T9W2-O]
MEKLHKYCLSVLLVIICTNISAQVSNDSVENADCQHLYRLYSQIFQQNHEASKGFSVHKRSIRNFAISHKENAVDLIGGSYSDQDQKFSFKNTYGADIAEKQKHQLLLNNFEKNSKENFFNINLYFKTKVSKVRNKDYLSVIG